jgi:hypothetical protein
MESGSSILLLKVPATCPCPEPDQSSLCLPSHFLKINLNIILPSTPRSSKWPLCLRFPYQKPSRTSPLLHTCQIFVVCKKSYTRLKDIRVVKNFAVNGWVEINEYTFLNLTLSDHFSPWKMSPGHIA